MPVLVPVPSSCSFPLEYPSLFLLHFPPFRPYAAVLPSLLQLYISAASCAQSFCLHANAVSCLQRDCAACGITVPDLLLCFFCDVVDPKAPPPPHFILVTVSVFTPPVPGINLSSRSRCRSRCRSRSRSRLHCSLHFRSRSRPCLVYPLSRPPRFLFLISPYLCSRPRFRSFFRSRPHILFPRPCFSFHFDVRTQVPGLTKRAVGSPQASLFVCRDDIACGMKMATVKQEKSPPKT